MHLVALATKQLGVQSRVVLPDSVRKALGLQEGNWLVRRLREDGVIKLVGAREVVQEVKGILGRVYPTPKGKALTQKLIHDHHRDVFELR